MTMNCRVLPHETGDGAWNMALDEALLEAVAADPSAAALRTYEWSEPTLSLGYFQAIAEAEADPRWRGAAIVRRPTGGGALWHDRELTYAVVVPVGHPASRPSQALYRAIHGAVARRLRELGVDARRRGEADLTGGGSPGRPFLCFNDRDADDVVSGEIKLVGSAQRRRSGAVLQHGSLLLARSPTTPELAGLADVSGAPPGALAWAEVLAAELPAALGMTPVPSASRPEERARAETLRRDVYARSTWTRRR